MKTLSRLLCLAVALGAPLRAAQTVPTLNASGTLSDADGKPLFGSFLLQFHIFDGSGSERPAWTESRYVKAEGGRFTAVLGRQQRIPEAVLQGAFHIVAQPPIGTGWRASVFGSPEISRAASVQPQSGAASEALGEAGGDVRRLERELGNAKDEVARAHRQSEESRRRLDAIEQTLSDPPAASTPAGPRIYVVQAGDTLRSVALKTLGDERHWIAVYQANDDRIQRAGELVAGQKLLIPALAR